MTNLIYLIKSLVLNLGLDKTPSMADSRLTFLEGGMSTVMGGAPMTRTLEERRAFLGCMFFASIKYATLASDRLFGGIAAHFLQVVDIYEHDGCSVVPGLR